MSRLQVPNKMLLNPVPPGGAAGQVLAKSSSADYAMSWVNQSGGGGGVTLPLTQDLTFTPDNTYAIGASAASRPNAIYTSGFLQTGIDATQRLTIGTPTGGAYITGSNAQNQIQFGTSGFPRWNITPSGHLLAGSDNSYDIGANQATRPRTVYAASELRAGDMYLSEDTLSAPFSLRLANNTTVRWQMTSAGHLLAWTDNAYDIGAAGAKPRDLLLARDLRVAGSAGVVGSAAIGFSTPQASTQLYVYTGATTAGGSQYGIQLTTSFSSAATTLGAAISVAFATGAGTFTMVNGYGVRLAAPALQAGNTITDMYGINVANQGGTGRTNAYGVYIAAQSGAATLNYGLYNAGKTRLNDTLDWQTDNTYDVGASASGRPRYVYAGSGVVTPIASTPLVQSTGQLALGANSAARWRIHTTGDLWAETDNAYDIGASAGSRPRTIYAALNVLAGSGTAAVTLGSASAAAYISGGGGNTLIFGSAGTARWKVDGSGHLIANTDSTYDIGLSGANRPRDLWLARNATVGGYLDVGNPVGGRLYVAAGSTPALILKNDTFSSAITQVSGQMQASLTANAYWTGTTWARIASNPATTLDLSYNQLTLYKAPSAGAATPPSFAQWLNVVDSEMKFTGQVDVALISAQGKAPSGGGGFQAYNGANGARGLFWNDGSSVQVAADGSTSLPLKLLAAGGIELNSGPSGAMTFGPGNGIASFNCNQITMYGDTTIQRVGAGSMMIPATGIGGANVGTNGVNFSVHSNYYGGVYYSTGGAFLTWPSEGRFKADQAALPDPLRFMDRAAIRYRQPSVAWQDGHALLAQDEGGDIRWGFRAEEWDDIPELVGDTMEGVRSFALTNMIPLTWEAVRALYAEVATLKLRVKELENA